MTCRAFIAWVESSAEKPGPAPPGHTDRKSVDTAYFDGDGWTNFRYCSATRMATDRRIYFVNPPYERIAPGYAFIKHLTNRSPSLGLLHLAAQVREVGYEPTILESDILDLDFDGVADRIIAARRGTSASPFYRRRLGLGPHRPQGQAGSAGHRDYCRRATHQFDGAGDRQAVHGV